MIPVSGWLFEFVRSSDQGEHRSLRYCKLILTGWFTAPAGRCTGSQEKEGTAGNSLVRGVMVLAHRALWVMFGKYCRSERSGMAR